jgi:hypothetical protein
MALKIPLSRLNDNVTAGLVKSGSITREELKFAQFISRLRRMYLGGLYHLLRIELVMSGVMTDSEWDKFSNRILLSITSVDYFAESKKLELLTDQLTVLQTMDPYIEKFFSQEYVLKEILNMTDDGIIKLKAQLENPILGGADGDGSDEFGSDDSELSPDDLGDDNAPYNDVGEFGGEPNPDELEPDIVPEEPPAEPKSK